MDAFNAVVPAEVLRRIEGWAEMLPGSTSSFAKGRYYAVEQVVLCYKTFSIETERQIGYFAGDNYVYTLEKW